MSDLPPSLAAMRLVVAALQAFLRLSRYSSNYGQRQERRCLRPFVRLADGLWALRPFRDELARGNPRVARALSDLDEAFQQVACRWGWERLIEPGGGRRAFLEERRERFRALYDRPRYEAAIGWQEGSRRLADCPWEVDRIAATGRALGYGATMSAEEARARYALVNAERFDAPRLGHMCAHFTPEDEAALASAHDALRRLVEQAERNGDSSPGKAVGPALRRAAGRRASPENLAGRAVALAFEALNRGERINVAAVARALGCERTKLYDLSGFRALVERDRMGADAAKQRRARGTKEARTGRVEAWREDD
jgi:hypothetical protein